MTEAEWLAEEDQCRKWSAVAEAARWSDRTFRLYVAAFWTWLADGLVTDPESHLTTWMRTIHGPDLRALAAALEEWAESGTLAEPHQTRSSKWSIFFDPAARDVAWHTTSRVTLSWGNWFEPSRAVLCGLLDDILGNPFRPVRLDPGWRTEAVVGLAAGAYADRAFDRLPVLADALEDAGCADPDVLGHCRSGGPHARGCWVVDLILGKA